MKTFLSKPLLVLLIWAALLLLLATATLFMLGCGLLIRLLLGGQALGRLIRGSRGREERRETPGSELQPLEKSE